MEDALCELERAIREFDRWILIQETIMQAAESFVTLAYLPLLSIEFDFNHVVSVGAKVSFVLYHSSTCNKYLKRNFEE